MLVQRGSAGNEVTMVQHALRAVYYDIAVDGIFGPLTETAVMQFQRSDGRPATGVVDDELYGRMQEIAGMLIVSASQVNQPLYSTPYIPVIIRNNVPAVLPSGSTIPATPGPTSTVAAVQSGISTAMFVAMALLGTTLYVVYNRRTA